MTQVELNSAVAHVTGESLATVHQLGFQLADPLDPNYDPEPRRPMTIDWDNMSMVEWPHA